MWIRAVQHHLSVCKKAPGLLAQDEVKVGQSSGHVINDGRKRLRQSSYYSKRLRRLRRRGLAGCSKLGCSKKSVLRGPRLGRLERSRRLMRQQSEPRSSRLVGLSNNSRMVLN
jgi:hypothetical protein